MKKSLLFVFCSLVFFANAQQNNLPIGLTPEEQQILEEGHYQPPVFDDRDLRGVSTAPAFPVRTMAQWEELQTLVLAWTSYPSILAQIVDAAQEECEVLIHCSDSVQVINYLTGAGVPTTNVRFLEVPFNSIWIRDYGAHTVYKNEVDSVLLVEWIYNRPTRPDDDYLPNYYAAYKGIGLHSTTAAPNDLVNTGGNWMVDGFGTAFASKLILDENASGNSYGVTAKTEADIDTIMSHFMGIERYIKMETLPYDQIHHIDMHMKLLNEETILMGQYPNGVSDGPQIEANLLYVLNNYNSVYGTPYKFVRIMQPPGVNGGYPPASGNDGWYRTFTNSVIINKTVLVPFYRTEVDTVAQRIIGEAMPGYNIVGIDVDNNGSALISLSGALHCITNMIGVDDPLLISHQNLPDTYDDQNPYLVNAYITHKTGIANATLYWSLTPGTNYTAVSMTAAGNNNWTANIPAQAIGSHVYYYIHAEAINGKQQVRPMTAPDGYFHFRVLDAAAAVNDISLNGLMDVFPNPASAVTCIPVKSAIAREGCIKMYDVLGNLVETVYRGTIPVGESRYFIHANEYPAGAYLIVLEAADVRSVQQLIIR